MRSTCVVYKVDRLTRSLADFAKMVELFDQQAVSFVSVTQAFNTTTSMGRLTLNVLLSFAQFEREVTGERIRDKIAASKRKGMWMGGVVPIGYDLESRTLRVNEPEAAAVREIFAAYLRLGCVSKLQQYLEQQGITSKKRLSGSGRSSGGRAFSRGALYELLRNRIYLGQITHKGASFPGQHPAIIAQEIWDETQARLSSNLQAKRHRARSAESSLLTGLLSDSAGNRYTPTHASKKGRRYRYYTSSPADGSRATRLPAAELEEVVIHRVEQLLRSPQSMLEALKAGPHPDQVRETLDVIQTCPEASIVVRESVSSVVLHPDHLLIAIDRHRLWKAVAGPLAPPPAYENDAKVMLEAPCHLARCRGVLRAVLSPETETSRRPDPVLTRALARAHHWAGLLASGQVANQRSLAERMGLDERYVSRLLPLAFLSPRITEDVLDGKAPATLTLDLLVRAAAFTGWEQQQRVLELR